MKSNDFVELEEEQAEKICDVCGSIKILEDDKYICPHCDGEIDYFGEDDDDDKNDTK